MKAKIFYVAMALVLVLSFSLVTAVPVAATEPPEPDAIVFPFELGGKADGNYVAEWSEQVHDGSSSVHLATAGTAGNEARILIDLSDLPEGEELKLGEIESISWWVYAVTGYPPHLDITLDTTDTDQSMLTAEMNLNCVGAPKPIAELKDLIQYGTGWLQTFEITSGDGFGDINDDTIFWVTKMGSGDQNAPWGPLADWKGSTVANDPEGELADTEIGSETVVLSLEIEVDNWVVQSEAYIDDITFKGVGEAPILLCGQIQDAIDSVSGESPFIYVMPGTYNENVDVNKQVTIIGAGEADTIVTAADDHENVFEVTANGVNIFGFTVKGVDRYANSPMKAGIYLDGVESCTISNNTATENYIGIRLEGADSNTITGNTCNENYQIGIALESSSSNDIIDNTCTSNAAQGISLYLAEENTLMDNRCNLNGMNGIYLSKSSYNPITGNTCNSNGDSGMHLTGMGPDAESSYNTITGNTCNSNQGGMLGAGGGIILAGSTPDNTIKGNTCNSNTKYGIRLWFSNNDNNIIEGNTFQENDIQVLDSAKTLDIEQVLEVNHFDRAVVVDHEGALLHTIWSYIQDGIDNAEPNDTINVAAGTYEESVTVNQALTLLGAKMNVDPRGEAWTSDITTINADGNSGILVTASSVMVNGFKVTGGGTAGNVNDASGGIVVYSRGSQLTNIAVQYCWLDANPGNGIFVRYADSPVVEYNYCSNNGGTANMAGISVNELVDGSISYNECSGNHNYGIYVGHISTTGTILSHNDVHGNGKYGIQLINQGTGVSEVQVVDNKVYENGRNGLKIVSATHCTIQSNEFYGNGSGEEATSDEYRYGVLVEACIGASNKEGITTGNTFTRNTFHDNALGGAFLWYRSAGHSESLAGTSFEFNNFQEGSGKWGINNTSPDSVDATSNWWGNASGPKHAATNPDAIGDEVTDNVNYIPWLDAPYPAGNWVYPVSGSKPSVTLQDEAGDIATVGISGAPSQALGTITGTRYPSDPKLGGKTLMAGTGKTGVVFLDVKVTGYTSGMAHIIVPYDDAALALAGVVEETLGLYYYSDEVAGMWRIATNSKVVTTPKTVSGDVPVSALGGTPIGLGAYPEDEATVAIGLVSVGYSGNDIVVLTIKTNTAQLGAVTIDLTFDNTVVEVLGGENGAFDSLTVNPVFETGKARFVANQLGATGVDATGVDGAVLAQVRLKAVGNTGSSSPLELTVITLKDNDGIAIPKDDVTNGLATIGGLGDANSDGAVDVYDCVYIARAIAGSSAIASTKLLWMLMVRMV